MSSGGLENGFLLKPGFPEEWNFCKKKVVLLRTWPPSAEMIREREEIDGSSMLDSGQGKNKKEKVHLQGGTGCLSFLSKT